MEIIEQKVHLPDGEAKGPSIFCLHGAWSDASSFDPLGRELAARGLGSTAISLPGHGSSTMHKGEIGFYSIRDYVRIVLTELERVDRKPLLCGAGLGAWILMRVCEEVQVPGLVMLAPPPLTGLWKPGLRLLAKDPFWLIRNALRGFEDPWRDGSRRANRLIGVDPPPARESRTVFRELLRNPHREPADTRVLVVSGSNDLLFKTAEYGATARSLDGKHVAIPFAKHDLCQDPWAKDVAALIEGFAASSGEPRALAHE